MTMGTTRIWQGAAAIGGFVGITLLTFIGLLAITFFIGRVIPIDPVLAVVGDRATQEQYDAARAAMGLDRSLPAQFLHYVGDVFRGDLGWSVSTNRPVAEDLAVVFPATLEMATLGIIIGVALGVPLGVWAAARQGTWIDQAIRVLALLGYSVRPSGWGWSGWRFSMPVLAGSRGRGGSTSSMKGWSSRAPG